MKKEEKRADERDLSYIRAIVYEKKFNFTLNEQFERQGWRLPPYR